MSNDKRTVEEFSRKRQRQQEATELAEKQMKENLANDLRNLRQEISKDFVKEIHNPTPMDPMLKNPERWSKEEDTDY